MKRILPIFFVLTAAAIEAPGALADYTLELKNGRHITVQSYREEAGMIKFRGLGGEIGLSKDQIQSIRPTSAPEAGGLNVQADLTVSPASAGQSSSPPAGPEAGKEKALTPQEERAKEEREYLNKLESLTNELKGARDQYSLAIRGTTSPDPTQLVTEEQIKAREADAKSRFENARHNPSEPSPVKLLVPSPFTSLPPALEAVSPAPFPPAVPGAPAYTDQERELSDMRERANRLDQEREKLINEMRQKNFNTGSLFVE